MSKRAPGQRIRVLIVEDSRAQRELLVRLLEASGKFDIVGVATNGQEGVELARRLAPDVIAMDIHLPIVDGYEATRQIMECCPRPIVMVSNSLGDEGRRSVEALAAGALAVIRKPGSVTRGDFDANRQNLIKTLELMADVPVITRYPQRQQPILKPVRPKLSRAAVVAIAASTGGPAAVQMVLGSLAADFPLPILLVQHIASGFVQALTDWLRATLRLHVKIAQHGEAMKPGTLYLPPDDYHITAAQYGIVGLQRVVPQDRFWPSADILFESVATAYTDRAIGVILTGMGNDGSKGLRLLRERGSQTYAQDEASCVVYGMPHAAVEANAVVQVVPLEHIAHTILDYIGVGVEVTKGA